MCPSVRPSLRFIIRELCSGFPLVPPSYPLCEPCSELSTALRALLHHRGTSGPVCPSVRPSLWIIPPCASRRSISHCAFRTSLVAAPLRRSAPLPSSACFTFGLLPDKRRHSAQLIAKLFNFAMAPPHMVPDTAPPPSPPPADDVSEFDDSLPPDPPTDGVSVADSFDSSASLDVGFSMFFSASPHSRRGDRIRGKAQASSRKRSKR